MSAPTPESWAVAARLRPHMRVCLRAWRAKDADIDDILSDASIRIAKGWHTGVVSERDWARTIVLNVARDRHRWTITRREITPQFQRDSEQEGGVHTRHADRIDPVDPTTEQEGGDLYQCAGAELHADQALALIEQAWSHISDTDESALRGRYLDGAETDEIAQALDCDQANVKVRMFRARGRLAAQCAAIIATR